MSRRLDDDWPEQARTARVTPSNSPDDQFESQAMDLLQRVAAFGFSMSNKVGKEEFIQMMNEGALDHQQAADEVMQLVEAAASRVDNDVYMKGWQEGQSALLDELEKACRTMLAYPSGYMNSGVSIDVLRAKRQALTVKENA